MFFLEYTFITKLDSRQKPTNIGFYIHTDVTIRVQRGWIEKTPKRLWPEEILSETKKKASYISWGLQSLTSKGEVHKRIENFVVLLTTVIHRVVSVAELFFEFAYQLCVMVT